jgi:hypothetical protein
MWSHARHLPGTFLEGQTKTVKSRISIISLRAEICTWEQSVTQWTAAVGKGEKGLVIVGMDLNDTEGECTVRELYLSVFVPDSFIFKIKSRRMIWLEYAACIGGMRNQTQF